MRSGLLQPAFIILLITSAATARCLAGAVVVVITALWPMGTVDAGDWVLWGQSVPDSIGRDQVVAGFESKADCDRALGWYDRKAKEKGLQTVTEKTVSGLFYACFPATVDPRFNLERRPSEDLSAR